MHHHTYSGFNSHKIKVKTTIKKQPSEHPFGIKNKIHERFIYCFKGLELHGFSFNHSVFICSFLTFIYWFFLNTYFTTKYLRRALVCLFSTFFIKHGLLTRRAGFCRLRITTVYRSHWLLPWRMWKGTVFTAIKFSAFQKEWARDTLPPRRLSYFLTLFFLTVALPGVYFCFLCWGLVFLLNFWLVLWRKAKQAPPSHSFLVRILNNRARGHLQTGVIRLYLIHPPLATPSSSLTSCPVLAGPTSLPKWCPVLLSFHTRAMVLFPSDFSFYFLVYTERDTHSWTRFCTHVDVKSANEMHMWYLSLDLRYSFF